MGGGGGEGVFGIWGKLFFCKDTIGIPTNQSVKMSILGVLSEYFSGNYMEYFMHNQDPKRKGKQDYWLWWHETSFKDMYKAIGLEKIC